MTAITSLELLKRTRTRIEKPECWTQHSGARNRAGRAVLSTAKNAVCWCLTGAILLEYARVVAGTLDNKPLQGVYHGAFDAMSKHLPKGSTYLSYFNDYHGHAEVIDLLDKAIKDLEQ